MTGNNHDELLIGAPLVPAKRQRSGDLSLGNDSVTVQNWCAGSGNEIEEIRAGNGKILDHSEVQLLINAINSFEPSGASNPSGIRLGDLLPQEVATW